MKPTYMTLEIIAARQLFRAALQQRSINALPSHVHCIYCIATLKDPLQEFHIHDGPKEAYGSPFLVATLPRTSLAMSGGGGPDNSFLLLTSLLGNT